MDRVDAWLRSHARLVIAPTALATSCSWSLYWLGWGRLTHTIPWPLLCLITMPAVYLASFTLTSLLARMPLPGYTRLIRALVPEPARARLEDLMKTVLKDDFVDGLLDQGRAEGEARIILRILAARGLAVPDDVRDRVLGCADTAQLEAWADRAATANSVEEIFGTD